MLQELDPRCATGKAVCIFKAQKKMSYVVDGNGVIHFFEDFAEKGYESGSHGCSQLRDYQVAKWLYEQAGLATES